MGLNSFDLMMSLLFSVIHKGASILGCFFSWMSAPFFSHISMNAFQLGSVERVSWLPMTIRRLLARVSITLILWKKFKIFQMNVNEYARACKKINESHPFISDESQILFTRSNSWYNHNGFFLSLEFFCRAYVYFFKSVLAARFFNGFTLLRIRRYHANFFLKLFKFLYVVYNYLHFFRVESLQTKYTKRYNWVISYYSHLYSLCVFFYT